MEAAKINFLKCIKDICVSINLTTKKTDELDKFLELDKM